MSNAFPFSSCRLYSHLPNLVTVCLLFLFLQNYSETDCEKSNQESNKILSDRYSPSSKLTCGFCSKSDFPTFESLQLHVQVLHLPTGGADANLAASIRSLMHKRPLNSHAGIHLVFVFICFRHDSV